MNELVKVETNEKGEQLVNARELHKYLDIKKKFSSWWEQYENMFIADKDYTRVPRSYLVESGNGTSRFYDDYALKLSTAKHIAMLTKTKKGEKTRNYFLKLEEAWNSPEMIVKRALEYQEHKIKSLQQENTELKSMLLPTQTILKLDDRLYTTSEIAQECGYTGSMGVHQLNKQLHELGIIYPRKTKRGYNWHLYAKYRNKGYKDMSTIRVSQKWTSKGKDFVLEQVDDSSKSLERRV